MTPFNKSTTWVYFYELPPSHIYHGGQPGGTKVISLEINAFRGGLDEPAKRSLYTRFTEAVREHAGVAPDARVPVYIILREVDHVDWGMFGSTTAAAELHKPRPDEAPI